MSEHEISRNILFFAGNDSDTAAARAVDAKARLVERVMQGDEEAFTDFYKTFAPLVHGIILAKIPRDETDDLVQEVFISAYQKLHTLRDKRAVGAWLAMIARNRAIEFYRSEKPTEELSEDMRCRDNPQNEAEEILAAIRSLPEAYKETMVLRLVEGMTGPEIAEQTGLTPNSVRVNLHRGMKLLRRKLGIEE